MIFVFFSVARDQMLVPAPKRPSLDIGILLPRDLVHFGQHQGELIKMNAAHRDYRRTAYAICRARHVQIRHASPYKFIDLNIETPAEKAI